MISSCSNAWHVGLRVQSRLRPPAGASDAGCSTSSPGSSLQASPAYRPACRHCRQSRQLHVRAGPPEQQAPHAVPPPQRPPPMHPEQRPPRSHTQSLYHISDAPIRRFGFASGFHEKYELEREIGRGTFGTVFVGVNRSTGARYAVKRMPKRFSGPFLEQYYTRRVVNEVDVARHLGPSLSVCFLYEAYEDDKNVDLVMELCTGGQLWDRIRQGSYSEREAAKLMREILRAIAQCHGQDVLLRDVKPENFMFLSTEPDSPLKAIDFGIAVFCQPGQYIDVRAGTPIYIAPEVLKMRYTLSADIWSAGIIAYQLLTGKLPFAGEEGSSVAELYMSRQVFNSKDVFRAVLYAELDFESPPWDTLSPAAKHFVQSLLQRDEALRPTAEEALAHPWLREDAPLAPDAPLSDTIVQRLQRYGTYGQFRQAVLRQLAHALAEDEGSSLAGLRQAFQQLDTQGSGRVSCERLRAALLDQEHFNMSAEEAEQLLAQLDQDHSGDIDVDEFLAAMVDWRDVRSTGDWDRMVSEAFSSLDMAGKGQLSPEDLERLLCGEEGCEVPDTVEAALREADSDHDGMVSLSDFKAFLEAKQDDSLSLFESRLRSRDSDSSGSGSSGEEQPQEEGGQG